MKSHEDGSTNTDIELFRQEAYALGFGDDSDAVNEVADIESADDFIARMKLADEQSEEGRSRNNQPARITARRGRLRRWTVVGVGIAASAALVLGITQIGSTPAVAAAPPVLDFEFASAVRIAFAPGEDPASVLKLLSTAAARRPASAPDAGQIQYRKSDNWYVDLDDTGSSRIVPRVSETWLRPDGSLTTHEAIGQPLRADGRGAQAIGGKQVVDETLKAGSVDANFAKSLPTEPRQLANALLDHSECESRAKGEIRSMCLYREIVGLTQTYTVSSGLEAAIWTMLKTESGFRSLGSVQDRAGRDAIGISIIDSNEPHVRHLLIGSPEDGRIVGYEEILIKVDPDIDVKPPSVLSFSTVLDSRMTSTAPR